MTSSRVLLISAGVEQTTTANTTLYLSLGNAALDTPTSAEALRHILYRTAGRVSQLYVRVTANTIAGNSTITVRNNAADTALTVTIGPNTPGVFQDTTHEITIAAGDKLAYRFVPGASTGTITLAVLAVAFDTNSGTTTLTRLVCGGVGTGVSTASTSRYNAISGEFTAANAVESVCKARIKTPCLCKNLAVNVSANARTTNTTFRMRKNGANGNQVITYGPSETGLKEDITNSDSLAVEDDYTSVVETLTGTEAMTVRSLCVDMETTNSIASLVCARTTGINHNANLTAYYPIAGSVSASTTENNRKVKALDTFTVSDLTLILSTNTVTAPSTLTLRKNGTDTALAITIQESTSGITTNNSDTVSFTANDELSLALAAGATGTTMTIRFISVNMFGFTARVPTLTPESDLITEQKARQKASWRMQP